MCVCFCVLHTHTYIYIVMQQTLFSVIYKLNYCELQPHLIIYKLKFCFNFECPKVCEVLMHLMYAIETQNLAKLCTKYCLIEISFKDMLQS